MPSGHAYKRHQSTFINGSGYCERLMKARDSVRDPHVDLYKICMIYFLFIIMRLSIDFLKISIPLLYTLYLSNLVSLCICMGSLDTEKKFLIYVGSERDICTGIYVSFSHCITSYLHVCVREIQKQKEYIFAKKHIYRTINVNMIINIDYLLA